MHWLWVGLEPRSLQIAWPLLQRARPLRHLDLSPYNHIISCCQITTISVCFISAVVFWDFPEMGMSESDAVVSTLVILSASLFSIAFTETSFTFLSSLVGESVVGDG